MDILRKVLTKERNPKNDGRYYTNFGETIYVLQSNNWYLPKHLITNDTYSPEYWYEQISAEQLFEEECNKNWKAWYNLKASVHNKLMTKYAQERIEKAIIWYRSMTAEPLTDLVKEMIQRAAGLIE